MLRGYTHGSWKVQNDERLVSFSMARHFHLLVCFHEIVELSKVSVTTRSPASYAGGSVSEHQHISVNMRTTRSCCFTVSVVGFHGEGSATRTCVHVMVVCRDVNGCGKSWCVSVQVMVVCCDVNG